MSRTTTVWTQGRAALTTQEKWGTYPTIASTDYQRSVEQSILDGNGRLLEVLRLTDEYEAPHPEYGHSSAEVVDYAYGPTGALASTTTRYRYAQGGGGAASAEAVSKIDTWITDARGTPFVASVEAVNLGYSQDPTVFAFFPDGMIQGFSIKRESCGGGCHSDVESASFDDSGATLQSYSGSINRFGEPFGTSIVNHYAAGRLQSVSTNSYGTALTSAYGYDGAGNNVTRITTDSKGALSSSWTGVYDGAGNLLCERSVDAAGALQAIVHYDYSCF